MTCKHSNKGSKKDSAKEVKHEWLVYEYKTGENLKLVPDRLAVLTDMQIAMIISSNPTIRTATKAITPGWNVIDVCKGDLKNDLEQVKEPETVQD